MEATTEPTVFVPAFPTLAPEMLLRRAGRREHPFSSPTVRYFYFARNAIWRTVKMLGLDRGEVLVPAYHHGVEIESLLDAGAQVRFYRIGGRFEVDLDDVERKITSRTTALYLTHFGGFPGPVRDMKRLAEKHALPLIEDCALALFSRDGDGPLGITGDVAIFCLYKVLPVPHGGALVFNGPGTSGLSDLRPPPLLSCTLSLMSSSLLRNVALRGGRAGRRLRRAALGLGKSSLKAANITPVLTGTQHFDRAHLGLGFSRLSRRIVLGQDAEAIIATRRRNYLFLLDRLRDLSEPVFPTLPAGVVPLFYPMLVQDNRATVARLLARGIEAVDFWRDFHPACPAAEFPEVSRLRTGMMEVPCHQDLSLATMEKIAASVRDVLSSTDA
ncbi:MAG TPA: DegT/DnrJ/EryC1/StrS family aminotransferase [Candidatus Polarisedimenticolia bacterium]|nr:DegT/DnrJ/EryC1/StrS family aminotransferase [Candidatus Polarisedimenticolia bacterium]